MVKKYVVGLVFDETERVMLIEKKKDLIDKKVY